MNGKGLGIVFGAYFLWGILPIYWKQLTQVPADEIITWRVLGSVAFTLLLVLIKGSAGKLRPILRDGRKVMLIACCSVLITVNWTVFIWAVNNGHMLDSSLGYYINPLMSIALGAALFKEKLGREGIAAVICAGAGCVILVLGYGGVPWIALTLALSFALYGMVKKMLGLDSLNGLFVETLMLMPFALGYLIWVNLGSGRGVSFHSDLRTWLLLLGAGVVTAIPLMLFAEGTRRIDMIFVGFMQYVSPTMSLVLGVFVYHEALNRSKMAAFVAIWTGLIIFMATKFYRWRTQVPRGEECNVEVEEPV